MSLRRAAAARLSVDARLRISRARHGQLAWQERTVGTVRGLRGGRPPVGYVLVGSAGAPLHARVVEGFDAWEERRRTLDLVTGVLDARKVPYAHLDHSGWVVLVPDAHRDDALEAFAALDGPEWSVRADGERARRLGRRAGVLRSARVLEVFRALAAPDGSALDDGALAVQVQVWSAVRGDTTPCPDGGTFVPGTLRAPRYNGVVGYVTPEVWEKTQRRADRTLVPGVAVTEVVEPIDLVYTWVDGTDPDWCVARERAERDLDGAQINPTALSSSRFLGHDELRYSLRSVEMYASWVHRIHIVTCGQTPSWLDTSHPKIHLVDHHDIFSDPSVLPVFNSHAIESQLHHIDGLADRYLYLNDDVFFGRPVRPELFFEGNGNSRFFVSRALLDLGAPNVRDLPVMSAAKQNRALLEDIAGRTITHKMKHTPHPQQRAVLEELEDRWPEIFKTVMASTFRDPADHSIASALHHWYAYATRRAVEGEIAYEYLDLASDEAVLTLNRIARSRGFDVFCLNDTNLVEERRERAERLMSSMLREYFPLPSAFEREGA